MTEARVADLAKRGFKSARKDDTAAVDEAGEAEAV